MQVFSVTVERTARRRLRVLATSGPDAMAMVAATLPSGARATAADAVTDERITGSASPDLGLLALDHILTRDFLPMPDGLPSTVSDWLRMTPGPIGPQADRALAMAGLRVVCHDSGDLFVYFAAASHPMIARWVTGAPFAGAMFLASLAALPGATRPASGLRFAGISARVVGLPWSTVFEGASA